MEYRLLGGSGFRVPALSLGTATFGGAKDNACAWGTTQVEEATRLVDVALEAGLTLFDSADCYSNGLAEEILGKALAGRRGRVLVSTKAGLRSGSGADDVGSSRAHLVAACEGSLRRLGIDHIDLWQIHGFDALTPIDETLRALDDLQRAGKVRFVGCSNFSGWRLMKSLAAADRHGWPRYVAHQAYYNLLAREYEWELLPLAIDQEVGTVVWGALAGGQLTGKLERNRPPPTGSRAASPGGAGPAHPPEELHRILDTLRAIAGETGRTVAQVALRWVLQGPTVSTIVLGARDEAQLRDNLGAVELVLSADHMRRLDEVSARPLLYPYWHQRATLAERNPPPVPMIRK